MKQRGQPTPYAVRVKIGELASAGKSDAQIALELDDNYWTVRKWRRRFEKQGKPGLVSTMGRPAAGALSTFSSTVCSAIRRLRETHPGWGADSILASLVWDEGWRLDELPSRSSVAAFLKQSGLTKRYGYRAPLPEPEEQTVTRPHQEWELDAMGDQMVKGVGRVSLINIIDVLSSLKVESYPCLNQRNPATPEYYLTLRRAFLQFGLPERITFDRATVFYDNTSASPWPTKLHLWLIALGIEASFTRRRCPTDHARIERMHQTIDGQALRGQTWSDPTALWAGLDRRRDALNHHLPVRTMDRQAPLLAFPNAVHSQRSYQPAWEEEMLQLERIYSYLASGRWFRKVNKSGHFSIGGHFYQTCWRWHSKTVELTFDAPTVSLICTLEGGTEPPMRIPVQGLSKAELMGELSAVQRLPDFQLSLPWSADTWRSLAYAELLAA